MGFGDASLLDPIQKLYAFQYTQNMAPYIGQTSSAIRGFAENPTSTYNPMSGQQWDQYTSAMYKNPAAYSLREQLGSLSNTNEFFSAGKRYRDMMAASQSNMGASQGIMGALGQERQYQMGGMQNAYQRQMQAINMQGRQMAAPFGIAGVENVAQQKSLLESLFS